MFIFLLLKNNKYNYLSIISVQSMLPRLFILILINDIRYASYIPLYFITIYGVTFKILIPVFDILVYMINLHKDENIIYITR